HKIREQSLLSGKRFASLTASHGVKSYLIDVLADKRHGAIAHRHDHAVGMVRLKASAAPRSARQIAARAIKRFLLDRRGDIEINGQAGADRTSRIREPHHVKTSPKAGNVTDHDRIAQSVGDLRKANRRATVAIVPNPAMIRSAAPADARSGAVWPCD